VNLKNLARLPLHFSKRQMDWLCIGAGIVALASYLQLLPVEHWGYPWALHYRIRVVREMFNGTADLLDLRQDIAGFRRLVQNRDPYPGIDEYYEDADLRTPKGGGWGPSTHPPTAFLFAAPIAYLSASVREGAWVASELALIFCAFVWYGLRWPRAFGLALCLGLLWGPVAYSYHQLVIIWFAAVAFAYRYRTSAPFWSGVGIAAASLTKLAPIGIVGYYVFMRKYRAVAAVLLVWSIAIAAVLWLEPHAFNYYLGGATRANTAVTMIRRDNNSIYTQLYLLAGIPGLVGGIAYIGALMWRNRSALFAPAASPDYSFFLYSFLTVALLPICWLYSLVPLLPVLGYFILRGNRTHRVIAVACLILLAPLDCTTHAIFLRLPITWALACFSLFLTSALFWLEPVKGSGGLLKKRDFLPDAIAG
jgi:hypothetical protein